MHDNEKRILSKAENKRNLKVGDKNKKPEETNEAVNLLSRE